MAVMPFHKALIAQRVWVYEKHFAVEGDRIRAVTEDTFAVFGADQMPRIYQNKDYGRLVMAFDHKPKDDELKE